jgi:glycosyltransferase involved in cell wall biosynthesis
METNKESLNRISKLPVRPEIGVIALVADDWSDRWMSRHQILTRLATYFEVVWVNPSPNWREILHEPTTREQTGSRLHDGFHIYEPEFWLPRLYRPRFLADFTFRKRIERAKRLLCRKGCQKIILYLWHPEFEQGLNAIDFDSSCYHIVDEYSFSDVDLPNSPQERKILERVDQVIVHTPALLEKKGPLSRRISLIPNGVAYSTFASAVPEPSALVKIPHPRIGYAGFLKKTLDWKLLGELSRRHLDWSFVFAGAKTHHPEVVEAVLRLSNRPNVYFLGGMSSLEIAKYPQHFDVCLMPYQINDYTNYVYPLKLHEYLASGRPVVASRIRLVSQFDRVIPICAAVEEWSSAISKALQPQANSPESRKARQAIARQYDWDGIVDRIAQILWQNLDIHGELLEQPTDVADLEMLRC